MVAFIDQEATEKAAEIEAKVSFISAAQFGISFLY